MTNRARVGLPTASPRVPAADRGTMPSSWRGLRPVTVSVAVIGLLITGLLTWAAWTANDSSNSSLLDLQARQTASTLSAAIPGIQSQLADAVTVAIDTGNPATFQKFVSNNVGRSTLASVSLWQRSGTRTVLLATVGSEPQLVADGRVTAFFATVEPSPMLQVTRILPGSPPRLGFAEFPPGKSSYIVYAESPLPADKRLTIPKGSPFSQLNFALYLGRQTDNSALIESSVVTPVRGQHSTVRVPFGNTSITLVASPRTTLTPAVSQALPWIALGLGLALSLASAAIAENLSRRRRRAEEMNDELTSLYSAQRSIAETLQHSLLPEQLPQVSGMEIAARYSPGAQGVDIGGDWYDVVEVGHDRFVFIVGDVSGRGVKAASVMASLRFASRGFALEGHRPAEILGSLTRLLDVGSDAHFATVLCGLVDVGRHEVTLANAGHLPPLLRAGGSTTVLEAPPMAPIGVATAAPAETAAIRVPEGSLLLIYTDGLVERRGESLDETIDRLRSSLLQDSPSVDALLGSIIADLTDGTPDDDVAVLGLKWLA